MKKILTVIIILFCTATALHAHEGPQTKSLSTIAEQFKSKVGQPRVKEFEEFTNGFVDFYEQKPGKILRRQRPLVKSEISKARVIELLGKPINEYKQAGILYYNLGTERKTYTVGWLIFQDDVLINAHTMTYW